MLFTKQRLFLLVIIFSTQSATAQTKDPYQLVWSDEFDNKDGVPDSTKWNYEKGFVRNQELQWYQPANTHCESGALIIEARREQQPNPLYVKGSKDWRKKDSLIHYTSSCLLTRGKQSWTYGRFEMRARIDISPGMWPAWWTLGVAKQWPANGEIDIMEYYRDKLLANILCLGKENKQEWHTTTRSVAAMGGTEWSAAFHIWKMDWNESFVALYVDDSLLNKVAVDSLVNKDGSSFNPFKQPHYMLLNLAIGGQNGGDPTNTSFPRRFEIDYVRVYQEVKNKK
ncbi:MAG: glycoside hydrolase family 16 protein [Bacteroidota bacterium]